MRGYVLLRLGEALVAVWGVLTIVFVVLRLSGDPTLLLLPVGATPAQVAEFRHELGFDRPLLVQYTAFLERAVRGDFAVSLRSGQPALALVLERLPATAVLALGALGIAALAGGAAGLLAAAHRGRAVELVVMGGALLGQAMPVFWLGVLLILVFGVQLHWLPTGGSGDLRHAILPVTTLAAYSSASIARLFRSSLLDVLQQDYIRTARGKGAAPRAVLLRHAARNALLPVVTIVGLQAGTLLGGSVITETIFAWPGVGRLAIQAIQNRDFPVVQAAVTTVAVTFVLVNLGVDLLYSAIDPRVRVAD
jgi:peptide/nickel transport system permease protein